MPDFSIIQQAPEIRAIVQEGALERTFHDALFPRLLFRGEAAPVLFPGNIGDSMTFTGVGLVLPNLAPIAPGVDPTPVSYQYEQWSAQMQQYAGTIDSNLPTAVTAIANLFLRNVHQIGLQAAQSLSRIVRDRLYNSALSGWTTCSTAPAGIYGGAGDTAVQVRSVNGFLTARRPDLVNGSPVLFAAVSANNPLGITIILDDASLHDTTVTACTPDTAGDENGPGVITIADAIPGGRNVPLDAAIYADDRSGIVRATGALKTSGVAGQLLTMALIRSAIARLRTQNVPEHPDGRYHCHLDPTSESQVFSDAEIQRLITALPDYYMYKQMALGEALGTVFFQNSECPSGSTVTRSGVLETYSVADPFAGQLYSDDLPATGNPVHRPLFTGAGCIHEYYLNLDLLTTEAGVGGKVGAPKLTNNGVEINAERIQLIIRWPQDRLQNTISTSWKFIGDWPVRTDVTTGDAARYKRSLVIEHGE